MSPKKAHQSQSEAPLTSLIVQHDGLEWPLWKADDSEAYILDVDWAVRLGYANPPQIRELIARMISDCQLGVVRTVRKTSAASGGRPATEYYLTEGQALKVAARSRTKSADRMLDGLIAVFLKTRQGQLAPAASPTANLALVEGTRAALAHVLDLHTALVGQQSTITALAEKTQAVDGRVEALEGKVAAVKEFAELVDSRAGVRLRKKSAPPAPPESRAEPVLAAIKELLPNVTSRKIEQRTGFTQGQVRLTLEYLYMAGKVKQTGEALKPVYVLCDEPPPLKLGAPPAPSINPPVPVKPPEPDPERQEFLDLGPTSREILNKLVRQYAAFSGLSHADCWHEVRRFMEESGHKVTGRRKDGQPMTPIDYMDENRLCLRAAALAQKRWKFDPERDYRSAESRRS